MNGESSGDFLNLQRAVVAEPQTGDAIRILALELYDDGFRCGGHYQLDPGHFPKRPRKRG